MRVESFQTGACGGGAVINPAKIPAGGSDRDEPRQALFLNTFWEFLTLLFHASILQYQYPIVFEMAFKSNGQFPLSKHCNYNISDVS